MKLILIAAGLYVTLLVATYLLRDRLILPGRRGDPPATPAAAGLAFDDVWIPIAGGSPLRAWWIPAEQPARRTVLYFHGNYETLETEATVEAPLLHATDADVPVSIRLRAPGWRSGSWRTPTTRSRWW